MVKERENISENQKIPGSIFLKLKSRVQHQEKCCLKVDGSRTQKKIKNKNSGIAWIQIRVLRKVLSGR